MNVISIILSLFSLGVAVIAMISTIRNNRFYVKIETDRRNEEIEKIREEKINNRPQFKVTLLESEVDYIESDNYNIDAFFLPYKKLTCDRSNYTPLWNKGEINLLGKKTEKKPICEYHDVYTKKKLWISFVYEFENIGKSNIDTFYLLSTFDRRGSLINVKGDYLYQSVKMSRSNEHIVRPDHRTVKIGEKFKLRLSFYKDYYIDNAFSADFVINMQTDVKDFWMQGMFINNRSEFQSSYLDPKEFDNYNSGEMLDAVIYDRVYWSTPKEE